jgi:hypothetical protein
VKPHEFEKAHPRFAAMLVTIAKVTKIWAIAAEWGAMFMAIGFLFKTDIPMAASWGVLWLIMLVSHNLRLAAVSLSGIDSALEIMALARSTEALMAGRDHFKAKAGSDVS